MLHLFFKGGIFMWPLLIILLSIIFISLKKAIDLFLRKNLEAKHIESGLNAILFWGVLSIIIGFIAHFCGLYLAMVEIANANDISPAIVAHGFAVSLITIIFGMLIFLFSAIFWLILRWRYKQRIAIV